MRLGGWGAVPLSRTLDVVGPFGLYVSVLVAVCVLGGKDGQK
jgi:hypothetical protein